MVVYVALFTIAERHHQVLRLTALSHMQDDHQLLVGSPAHTRYSFSFGSYI
jgi:hypothetical protein